MRVQILVKGIVQGVGFRPFVANAASLFKLNGWVRNTTEGVWMEVEGEEKNIFSFIQYLRNSPPPLSKIHSLHTKILLPKGYKGFKILSSSDGREKNLFVCADIATCKECLEEFYTPSNRRYLYPFINCTHCGPRFTIIKDTPYDRERTTMHSFTMCKECEKEYKESKDRRYHAQTIACKECGPSFTLLDARGRKIKCNSPLLEAAKFLRSGKIGLMKGLGGFHIIGSAMDKSVVKRIREIKRRDRKPFAILCMNPEKICKLSKEEERYLKSIEHPILLLEKKKNLPSLDEVAPNNRYLGVMLPYTAAHHYLLKTSEILAIICTSANFSDEPMCIKNEEAKKEFLKKVDFFLMHDRDIENRCDDSVAFFDGRELVVIRRGRGFVPLPFTLDANVDALVGCGAQLKCTFTLGKENQAFLSPPIGDLDNEKNFSFYKEMMEKYCRIFGIKPKVFVHDLHPEFLSTLFAKEKKEHIGVQHHHAHIASCMAEHRISPPLIGVAMDGVGFGEDGRVWGGEFFFLKNSHFERFCHLLYVHLPGADAANRQCWRMAVSWLYKVFGEKIKNLKIIKRYKKAPLIIEMMKKGINSPFTSSFGRLFDAVSSICGLIHSQSYEGEGPIALEAIVDESIKEAYHFHLDKSTYPWLIDPSSALEEIVMDVEKGIHPSYISSAFHNGVALIIKDVCVEASKIYKTKTIALSGGVFQNKILRKKLSKLLEDEGFSFYFNNLIPPNDAGVSVGQILFASYVLGNSCKSN